MPCKSNYDEIPEGALEAQCNKSRALILNVMFNLRDKYLSYTTKEDKIACELGQKLYNSKKKYSDEEKVMITWYKKHRDDEVKELIAFYNAVYEETKEYTVKAHVNNLNISFLKGKHYLSNESDMYKIDF